MNQNNKSLKKVYVDGIETSYLCSDDGSVYRNKWGRNVLLKPKCRYNKKGNGIGYIVLPIYMPDGSIKRMPAHRIIASAFIPNPQNKPQVNHKDGVSDNNCVSNLEWVTASENQNHALLIGLAKGRKGTSHHGCLLSEKEVIEIFKSNQSYSCLAKKYKVKLGAIADIKTGKNWSHVTGKRYVKTKVEISRDKVMAIFNSHKPYKEIQEEFNVCHTTVSDIKTGSSFSKYTGKVFVPQKPKRFITSLAEGR